MSRRDRTLARSTSDEKIAGVCSGLARYFDVDPLLVRVGFVAGLFVGGWTAIAYVLLWWLLPISDDVDESGLPAPTAAAAPSDPVAPTTTERAA